MKAILFDLDGTLLDTLQDIADACNAALTRQGFPPHPVNAYRYFVGDGVEALITRVVPSRHHDPAKLASVLAAYREEYHRRWKATTKPYAGVPEMLEELTRRKVALTVLSNKPDDFMHRCVTELLAYSDGFRTRFRRETGQWSDASRTPFRLKSDSVPADIGQF